MTTRSLPSLRERSVTLPKLVSKGAWLQWISTARRPQEGCQTARIHQAEDAQVPVLPQLLPVGAEITPVLPDRLVRADRRTGRSDPTQIQVARRICLNSIGARPCLSIRKRR